MGRLLGGDERMRETVDLPVAIEPVRAMMIIFGEWGGLGEERVDEMCVVVVGRGHEIVIILGGGANGSQIMCIVLEIVEMLN